MVLADLVAVVALSDQTVASEHILLVDAVVINRVTITALALATVSWAKNQLVKNLMAQEAVVLTTATRSARMMGRAQHVTTHQIVSVLEAALMNLLAIAHRAMHQAK